MGAAPRPPGPRRAVVAGVATALAIIVGGAIFTVFGLASLGDTGEDAGKIAAMLLGAFVVIVGVAVVAGINTTRAQDRAALPPPPASPSPMPQAPLPPGDDPGWHSSPSPF